MSALFRSLSTICFVTLCDFFWIHRLYLDLFEGNILISNILLIRQESKGFRTICVKQSRRLEEPEPGMFHVEILFHQLFMSRFRKVPYRLAKLLQSS